MRPPPPPPVKLPPAYRHDEMDWWEWAVVAVFVVASLGSIVGIAIWSLL